MKSVHFLFFLLITIALCPLSSHGCHEEERSALLNFKSSLEDPSNRLSSWKEGSKHKNCCEWHGVACSYDSFHVVSVDLRNIELENYIDEATKGDDTILPPSSSLTGKISPSLFKLSHLEYLDLSFNNFHSQRPEIPLLFSELTKLTHLDLSNTNFTASISTHLSNLSSLVYLDLSCQAISSLPYYSSSFSNYPTTCIKLSSSKWMRGLVNLQVLRFSSIDLSEATSSKQNFVQHIPYLWNLREVDISHCNIDDPNHLNLHNLSRLVSLKIGYNSVTSLIRLQLANLTMLTTLELPSCELQGSIPYLPQLKELDVSDNADLHIDLTSMFQHSWPKLQNLQMSSTNATGYILSLNAPQLVSFSASDCSIQGSSLPFSMYNLSLLQYLDLSDNNITSNLSSILNLRNLIFLDLSYNNFQGPISISICKIFPLRRLILDSNNITGVLPSCITMLKNIVDIRMSDNSIRVTVSLISLINNFKLTTLDLSSNKLNIMVDEGEHLYSKPTLETLALGFLHLNVFPTFICNSTHLKYLNLSHTNLKGSIPSCISELKSLLYLDLSNNKLRGPLPVLPQGVIHLDFSQNKLDGEISLGAGERLSSAKEISLNGNELSGTIPSSICSREPRKTYGPVFIDISNNKLSGIIPSSIGFCSSLWYLNLANNNLCGNVPNELQELEHLQYLKLSYNNLHGTFPKAIEKLLRLQGLDLGYNNFEGVIPYGFGQLSYLKIISLRSNKLNGSIPEGIYHMNFLQILDLSVNNFSGPISKGIKNLRKLIVQPSRTVLFSSGKLQFQLVTKGGVAQFDDLYGYSSGIDLSCNILDGKIPREIASLNGLVMLNLSHNLFSNNMPSNIGDMSKLESLDLSFNRLSGHIPQSLTKIDSLGFLSLSHNNLTGRIPRGNHFDTLGLEGSTFVGNDFLCGFPTEKDCEGDHNNGTNNTNASSETDNDNQEDAKQKLLVYAIAALGFGVGFWSLFLVLLQNKQKWWFPYWRVVDSVAIAIIERCIHKNE